MLLTIYILLQLIVIGAVIFTFKTKAPLATAVGMVMSGILMIGAWSLRIGYEYVWNPAIRAYSTQIINVSTPYIAGINIMIFGLCLVYFFADIIDIYKNESQGLGDVRPNGGRE